MLHNFRKGTESICNMLSLGLHFLQKKVQEIDPIIGLISIQYDDVSEKHSLLPTSMPSLLFPVECSVFLRTASLI